MIARTWRGVVPSAKADGFHAHLLATGVADYQGVEGFVAAEIWRRDGAAETEFLLVSRWADVGSMQRYAGPEEGVAVLYPGDEEFDLVPDRTVSLYEIVTPCVADLP